MNENSNPGTNIKQTSDMTLSPENKKSRRRIYGWGVSVLLVIIVMILLGTRNNAETVDYQTREVIRGDLTKTVSATGNLEPINQVDVGSELSGIIKTVEVDYNDSVKVGQVLARLDTDKLNAQVLQSKAALESAQAQVMQVQATLRQARAELKRLRQVHELSGGKVPSVFDLESAEAALSRAQADEVNAKAQVAKARATLEVDETDLAKTLIRSPINGVVLSRDVEPGQTVAASLQAPVLFTLAEDLAKMELHVDVDEADVGQVRQGQEATFTVDAYPDLVFPARITQVRYGARNTDGVVTYETVLRLDNEDLLLMPGMTATADIIVSKVDNAILVPNAALRFTPREDGADKEGRSSSGSMVGKILPRPQRPKRPSTDNHGKKAAGAQQRIWIVKDRDLTAIPVTAGMSDGIMTEILSGDIEPGMELVVRIVSTKK
jgi:HlyD family secretion protein